MAGKHSNPLTRFWPVTFNRPAGATDRRRTTNTQHRPRPYATAPEPTLTGELLLQAIKAGA